MIRGFIVFGKMQIERSIVRFIKHIEAVYALLVERERTLHAC